MKSRTLIPLLALAVISVSGRHIVKAASAPPSTTNGANVTGVVRFEGAAPKPTRINMGADPSCARQHPAPVFSEEVVTDAKGGLQNVIVFVADTVNQDQFEPPSQPVVLEQKGCVYEPHVLAMQANQQMVVVNDDPTSHNIHPVPANNREWNKSEPPGTKVQETFPREEIAIPVKCNIHPWMRGYIAVFKHPYFSLTAKDGSFSLRNLPPGTYTLKAWHEKLGTSTQNITVAANETRAVEFVFKQPAK